MNPPPKEIYETYQYYEYDIEVLHALPDTYEIADLDIYLDMEVLIPQDGENIREERQSREH